MERNVCKQVHRLRFVSGTQSCLYNESISYLLLHQDLLTNSSQSYKIKTVGLGAVGRTHNLFYLLLELRGDRYSKFSCCVEQLNLPGLLLPKFKAGDSLVGPAHLLLVPAALMARNDGSGGAGGAGKSILSSFKKPEIWAGFFVGQKGTEEAENRLVSAVPPAAHTQTSAPRAACAPEGSSTKATHRHPATPNLPAETKMPSSYQDIPLQALTLL